MRLIGLSGDGHELVADLISELHRCVRITFGERMRAEDAEQLVRRAECVRATAASVGATLMVVAGVSMPLEVDWLERHGGIRIVVQRLGSDSPPPEIRLRPVHVIVTDGEPDGLRRIVVDLVGQLLDEAAESV